MVVEDDQWGLGRSALPWPRVVSGRVRCRRFIRWDVILLRGGSPSVEWLVAQLTPICGQTYLTLEVVVP